MKFNLRLKEPHLKAISDLKEKFLAKSDQEIVNKCIESALNLNKNDLIFSTVKEKCSGVRFASEPQFEIELDENTLCNLKNLY